jgi:valyl-tRNA synthetase
VLDPDRKKLSKSAGNAASPAHVLERFGSDAVRYWATSARLGVDTAVDEGQLKVGRRLATKLLNAARFVLSFDCPQETDVDAAVDRAMLDRLADTVAAATAAFDRYGHADALAATEAFFWWWCDDHLELVKSRAYGENGPAPAASAVAALRAALAVLVRLFAPFLPFVAAEVWSWWRDGSVHLARWPEPGPLRALARRSNPALSDLASWVLAAIRRAKSEARVSMRAPVEQVLVRVDEGAAAALRPAATDLSLAAAATHLTIETRVGDPEVLVILAQD